MFPIHHRIALSVNKYHITSLIVCFKWHFMMVCDYNSHTKAFGVFNGFYGGYTIVTGNDCIHSISISFFDDRLAVILKNALGAALYRLPVSALIVLINLAPVLLLVFSVDLFIIALIFWLLIGVALSAYGNGKMILKVFQKVFLQPEE